VETGDLVGLVGGTGAAFGANHLHVEIRLGENRYESTRNPVLWLKPQPGYGVIAGLVLDVDGRPVPTLPVSFFRASEPDKWWREILTYASQEVNPDESLGENFALGYVPAGDYLVKVKLGDRAVVRPVTVRSGQIAFAVIEATE
jgi:murein DD-endopeptidase MepM/ murein hydrolase activator NlpD